jgi:hypothetical protein
MSLKSIAVICVMFVIALLALENMVPEGTTATADAPSDNMGLIIAGAIIFVLGIVYMGRKWLDSMDKEVEHSKHHQPDKSP